MIVFGPINITGSLFLGTVTGVVSLVRTTNGLLFFDSFTRSNQTGLGNGWIRTDGVGLDNIVSNEAVAQSPYGDSQLTASFSMPSSSIAQYNVKIGVGGIDFGDIWMRNQPDPAQNSNGIRVSQNVGLNFFNLEIRSGSNTLASMETAPGNTGISQSVRIVTEEYGFDGVKVRAYRATNLSDLSDMSKNLFQEGLELSSSTSPVLSDVVRSTNGTGVPWDNFMVCGRNIVVEELPQCWKARFIGTATTQSAVQEVGGTVVINVDSFALPGNGIEVLNECDKVVTSFFSSSGIWGGDKYTFVFPSA